MAFEVKVSGANRRLRVDWAQVAAGWADQVQPAGVAALKRAAPVRQGEGAGRLRDSIRAERTASAAELVIRFTSRVPYAGFVVGGTRAHEIVPRNARVLAWEGPGGPVFARHVNHPGTRPNRFPERALGPLAPEFQARLRALIAEQLTT